jgi:SAM-dependent methyltransferase
MALEVCGADSNRGYSGWPCGRTERDVRPRAVSHGLRCWRGLGTHPERLSTVLKFFMVERLLGTVPSKEAQQLNPGTAYYMNQREEMLAYLPAQFDRLLDVGCGEAAFGALVRQRFPAAEVWGVEPVATVAEVAAARLSQVVCAPFSAAIQLPAGHFDVITFNDSLEHMADEVEALRVAHSLLAPGGRLVCSVPNVRYFENLRKLLVEADWKYEKSGILDRTHLRFFTEKSIHRTVSACGFQVLRSEGINCLNPDWWNSAKMRLLRLVFRPHMADMQWQQFVVVARRLDAADTGAVAGVGA